MIDNIFVVGEFWDLIDFNNFAGSFDEVIHFDIFVIESYKN